MPVKSAEDGDLIEPQDVYVLPSGALLTIAQRKPSNYSVIW